MSAAGWHQSILAGIGARAGITAELHPRIYLLLLTLLALTGYSILLLFPALLLAALAGMYGALTAAPGIAWLQLLLCTVLAVLGGRVSYSLLRYRPSPPAGVVLERKEAPALFRLVEETAAHYDGPVIRHIVVTGEYRLDIVTHPRQALPLWPMHSLVVGLPLLQCLSTTRFECLLARRLGQFSRRANPLLNRLYALRSLWPCYAAPDAVADRGYLPLRWSFSLFAPLYTAISTGAARLDELQADSYAMELFDDTEVLDAITADTVYRLFLRERYWPAVRKLAELDPAAVSGSHSGMLTVLQAGLTADNLEQWLTRAMTVELPWDEPWPSLARRVDNIGHAGARMEPHPMESAEDAYLEVTGRDLGAKLDAQPRPQPPMALPPPQWLAGLQRWVQSMLQGLLQRRKGALH